jgi:RNase P subunit RPR2
VPDKFLMKNSGSQNKSEGHRQTSMRKIVNNDPCPIKIRFTTQCKKCGVKLTPGVQAYYWPSDRKLLCLNCGEEDFKQFLSSVADEDIFNGTGNPYPS